MRHKKGFPHCPNPTAQGFSGQPDDCFELVNRYGTYNIQPTADTKNTFPAIAQGLPRSLHDAEIAKEELREHGELNENT